MSDNITQDFRRLFTAALLGLKDQEHEHNPSTEGYAWFSELGYCPLKAGLRRCGVAPFFPLSDDEEADQQLKFEVGRRVAGILQERADDTFESEVVVIDHALRVSGKIDLVHLSGGGIDTVFEIKTTLRKQPNLGNAIQCLGYKMVTGAPHAIIVLVNPTGSYTLWYFVPDGEGFRVIDENGEHAKFAHNSGEWLNFPALRAAIHTHLNFIAFTKANKQSIEHVDVGLIAPIRLDNPEENWMCIDTISEPKRYQRKTARDGITYATGDVRLGEAFGTCEYFCHGPSRHIEIGLEDFQGEDRKTFKAKE